MDTRNLKRFPWKIRQATLLPVFMFLSGCGGNDIQNRNVTHDDPHRIEASQAMKLTETQWVLLQINGAPAPAGRNGRKADLTLTPTGQLNGFSGCNRFMGNYRLDGTHLQIGPLASTRMACPQGMELEHKFLQTLQTVDHLSIDGPTLNLYDADGRLVLRFSGKPAD